MRLVSQERLDQIGGPAELNMAPLIDMVFILLIFFLVTTTFVRETGLEIDRPSAESATDLETDSLLIAIDAEGRMTLHAEPVTRESLRGQLRVEHHRDPDRSVVIVADRASSHAALVTVIDEARLAGFDRIALASERQGR